MYTVGTEETANRVCRSFLTRSTETRANLQQSHAMDNIHELRRYAHSLKGASGYICSEQLKATALALQLACDDINEGRASGRERVDSCFNQLMDELALITQGIRNHLGEEPSSQPTGNNGAAPT